MLGLFRKPKKSPTVASRPRRADPLLWAKGTTLPIPDWEAVVPPEGVDLDEYWNAAAHDWLLHLGEQLSTSFSVSESEEFMLLSPLEARQRELILGFSEKARSRILGLLPGIASDSGHGKTVILIFDDQDQYYQYIANYYSDLDAADGRELALSGGMYLNRGYGHFVFVSSDLALVEPVIAHELTHSLLSHLPLPAWVNEGIAVNAERRLCATGRAFDPAERQAKLGAFWNAETIQEFWSGKAWLRADAGNPLSYELATILVEVASRDWSAFTGFVNAANAEDSADSAAMKHLGYGVAKLAAAVLGDGDWAPDPTKWTDGVERGQFGPLLVN